MKLLKMVFPCIILAILFTLSNPVSLAAQNKDQPISDTGKKQVVDKAFALLNDKYIFPEKIVRMEKAVRKKLADGEYSKAKTISEFLKTLNNDFETLINDRHVNIFYDPIRVKQIMAEEKNTTSVPAVNPEFIMRAKYDNYMVRKAERLEGNVGYLKLDQFMDIRISKPTIVSAMNFLSNSGALLIDLRQNGGGHANTVNFLLNYFLPDSTLSGHFTSRLTRSTTDIYTEHDAMIQKFDNKIPLFILVSKRTSSAAEGFAYSLQAFKRAKIIGDTTNGEANPGYALSINKDLFIMIPTSINRNAITKTNWQGVGVIPDLLIKSENALNAALSLAYKQMGTFPGNEIRRDMYDWLSYGYGAKADPIIPDIKDLQIFAGDYADNRKITLDQNNLYYQRVGISDKKRLIPLNKTLFELEGNSLFRIRFITNGKGQAEALEGIYDDGEKQISKKL